MGSRRESREAGRRGSSAGDIHREKTKSEISESEIPGPIPRWELAGWGERYGVVAGITGRGPGPGRGFDLGLWSGEPVGEVMSRWLALRRAMAEFTAVVLGNQVHGVEVREAPRSEGWIHIQGVDGWVTTAPGVLLTVTVADCIPVYLLVPGRAVALLHAGWRGTAGGILDRGIRALLQASKATEADVVMHCGVGICGACYEVGSEVMAGCGEPAEGPGPWHLDLRDVLTGRAHQLGLNGPSQSTWCSAHHRPAFYSHRASGGKDGRMVAYVGMTGKAGKKGRTGKYD
jgi:polyphenol oxidase